MAGGKNNATSSWSGYNHQGQVGIFLALKELRELLQKGEDYNGYSIEFEKKDGEDVDIVQNKIVISRHQVKAKTSGKVPSSYRDVLVNFNNQGVDENSMYLHTICRIDGFEEYKDKQKGKTPQIQFRNVKLYQYPDGNQYCELTNVSESKIDNFCKIEIKSILMECSHSLKDDDDHISETLFELKDLLCAKIREAHEAGGGSNPVILFSEIYKIVTSTEKREKQSIRRLKRLFEIYWNKNFDENIDSYLFNEILNLSPEQFKSFIIDLHPHKSINALKEEQLLDSLLDEDVFEEIFYEFYKEINQKFFNIYELRYNSTKSSYRLSLINKKYKKGEVGNLIQTIRNNRGFLKASFEVDYLVNGRINSPLLEHDLQNVDIISPYGQQPSMQDNLFSNYLEFIDIENTVEKLRGEKNE
ncbi:MULTISPECIES: ABC-three component system protein [unclassified Streptococcus]|uniref:ABC-three component system protein n=1 Tax=unclassified Streptococcus TaxID=2608887 RepID=UPI00359DE0CB